MSNLLLLWIVISSKKLLLWITVEKNQSRLDFLTKLTYMLL